MTQLIGGYSSSKYNGYPEVEWFCVNVYVKILCALRHTKQKIYF